MDIHSVFIVSKYLMSESDYVNLIKVSRKYKDLLMFFRYNPISDTTLFPMIQTQHFYKRDDTRYRISDMTHYIHWYEADQNEWMARSHLDTYKSVTLQNHEFTKPLGENNNDNNIIDNTIGNIIGRMCAWTCPLPIVKGVCIVPEGITKLGSSCFACCKGLTRVELPSTLREIGESAFEETSIDKIIIPEGVTSIGKDCFNQCIFLEKIVFPRTLKKIGKCCVINCGTELNVKISRDCKVGIGGLRGVKKVEYY